MTGRSTVPAADQPVNYVRVRSKQPLAPAICDISCSSNMTRSEEQTELVVLKR